MLYEPGPLALFTAEEIPVADVTRVFEALAVDQSEALEATASTIGLELATLAGAGENELEAHGVYDLAAAVDEHDRQSRGSDSSIAAVAGATDTLEDELAGLSSELAGDLRVDVPSGPTIPPDAYTRGGVPDDAPKTQWDAITVQQFRLLAQRAPSGAELVFARTFNPDVAALKAWILAGAPMDGSSTPDIPASTPPPPAEGAGRWSYHLANDPYGGVVGQWAHPYYDNPNIDPGATIKVLIDQARARLGTRAPQDDVSVMYLIATGQT